MFQANQEGLDYQIISLTLPDNHTLLFQEDSFLFFDNYYLSKYQLEYFWFDHYLSNLESVHLLQMSISQMDGQFEIQLCIRLKNKHRHN